MTEQDRMKNALKGLRNPDVRVHKEIRLPSIQAIEEVLQYREIGTVEECRAAVERMKPRKPVEYEDKFYGCPNCCNPLLHKWKKYPTVLTAKSEGLPYCLNCLQAIDWNEEE